MKRFLILLLILYSSYSYSQETLNGVVQIDMANSTDNSSPGITVKLNDDFLYDGKYLNHYGFGFHDFQDISSPLNGRNAYTSGYFGIDFFTCRTNRLRINFNGNVGIGTTTPSSKLDVNGDIKSSTFRIRNSSNRTVLENITGEHVYLRSGANSKNVIIADNFSTSNVGIGTSSPDGKLHVKGGIAIQHPTLSYDTSGNAGERAGIIFGTNHATKNSMFWVSPDATIGNRLNIGVGSGYSDSNAKLTIENSGNVGIGTTTPSAKLDVAGTIKAQEIEVTLASMQDLQLNGTLAANNITYTTNGQTADHVFESDYQLRDLSEVEAFITENKHLPDVPSAAAMEEEGVNLAEMNKLLLQKVEELTLYSIDLEKRDKEIIEKLEHEVKQVRREESEARGKLEKEMVAIKEMLLTVLGKETPNP